MTHLLLGLDIGTTATKCVLVDPGRGVIATDSRPVTLATVHAGWAEEDPATWWRNACELIPAVLTVAGTAAGTCSARCSREPRSASRTTRRCCAAWVPGWTG